MYEIIDSIRGGLVLLKFKRRSCVVERSEHMLHMGNAFFDSFREHYNIILVDKYSSLFHREQYDLCPFSEGAWCVL